MHGSYYCCALRAHACRSPGNGDAHHFLAAEREDEAIDLPQEPRVRTLTLTLTLTLALALALTQP